LSLMGHFKLPTHAQAFSIKLGLVAVDG